MGCIQSLFNKAQASGVSPSSTTDSASKAPVQDAPISSRPPSIGNVSTGKTEEPQSNDTSFGVEASAVSKLAADTGTLAIYSSTTCNSPGKDSEQAADGEEATSSDAVIVERSEQQAGTPEQAADPTESNEVGQGTSKTDAVRQVPQITETLVASLEPSPSDENEKEIPARYSPDGADQSSADVSGKTEVTKSTECSDDQPVQPKAEEVKSDNNESNSTKTFENDISSEQLKTNSLSDLSFSELDEKDLPKVVEVLERRDLSGESDHSDQKVLEITPDSTSESSQQITKEESTSDITTDHHSEDVKLEQDEEPLLDSGADDSMEQDVDSDKRTDAAIKIQSSFRGYQVRKTRSTKPEDDEDKLTESEIENVKTQVDDIIKEAEVKTESLRNTPDIDEEVNVAPEEEFPAPPDDLQLSQLEREDSRDQDKEMSLSIDANSGSKVLPAPAILGSASLGNEHSPPENEENTSAELAGMTADEDLPAPDMELLESSCTDDLNTEIVAPEKVSDEEPRDSTEGDVTISEDSEELKALQKPQECDDGHSLPQPEPVDEELAATKIQANVRGFLTRKQTQKGKKSKGSSVASDDKDDSPNTVNAVVEPTQPDQQRSDDNAEVTQQEPGPPTSVPLTPESNASDDVKTQPSALEDPASPSSGMNEVTAESQVSEASAAETKTTTESGEPASPVDSQLPSAPGENGQSSIEGDKEPNDVEDKSEPTNVIEDDDDMESIGGTKSEEETQNDENLSSKLEKLETLERIEFSTPSPSHDPPRSQGAHEDSSFDKISSTSESLSQDTTSTSQNTVEENHPPVQKSDDDRLDDVFEPPASDSKETKPEAVAEDAVVKRSESEFDPSQSEQPVPSSPVVSNHPLELEEDVAQETPVADDQSKNDLDTDATEPVSEISGQTEIDSKEDGPTKEPRQDAAVPSENPAESREGTVSRNDPDLDATVKSPVEPVRSPAEPVQSPTELVKSPTEPVKSPTEPVKSPIEPVKSPIEPVKSPIEPVKSPVEPVKSPAEPVKSPVEPVKSPIEPAKSPVEPVSPPNTTATHEMDDTSRKSFNPELNGSEDDPDKTKEGDEVLNASATKIQAHVRGYLTRKQQPGKTKE